MLTLYYARPSLYSRPVWIALLEKQLPVELIPVKMDGSQYEAEFTQISPFSHIPVLIDDGLRVIESSAILDYLEAKYPHPSLMPADAETIAKVRMVQSVAMSELLPAVAGLIIYARKPQELEYCTQRTHVVLTFFEELLENSFFGGENLSLADIVAGTLVPMLPKLDVSLANYFKVNDWTQRLLSRESWQQIQLSVEEWNSFERHLGTFVKVWQKRRRQFLQART
ncbi:MAG: glutathione S-transferase family protein [Cyanophyceae cyanobacterium]